jgi:hypothetical protein
MNVVPTTGSGLLVAAQRELVEGERVAGLEQRAVEHPEARGHRLLVERGVTR